LHVAGAFLLNAIHIPSALRLFLCGVLRIEFVPVVKYGTAESSMRPTQSNLRVVKSWLEEKGEIYGGFVETPIFIYSYEERSSLE